MTVTPLGGIEGQVKLHNWTRLLQLQLHDNKSRRSIPVHPDLHGSRNDKPNRDSKNNRSYQRNRYYKYLYPVIGLLIASPVSAADVGGVSATANPIANSSGSVTNQAIQVLQGPYITNTYGGGISCQGPTANSLLILLMPKMIRIHLKLFTWNLNMTTEILKEDW